jgi:hypothetical protein
VRPNVAFSCKTLRATYPQYLYFYIHGQGGIGKSFLVGRYQQMAREKGALTALTNEAEATAVRDQSIVQAMGRLAGELAEAGGALEPFDARYERYRQCMREIAADENAPHGALDRLGRVMTRAAMSAARETIIGAAIVEGGLELARTSEDALVKEGGAWPRYVARKF